MREQQKTETVVDIAILPTAEASGLYGSLPDNLYMEQIKQIPTLEFILGNNNTLTDIVAYDANDMAVGGFKFSDA